jgi:hypothetical protein
MINSRSSNNKADIPEEDPFTSLTTLRRWHSELLRRQQSANTSERPTVDDLTTFIAQVKATGRRLASEETRDAAQGVIDYWAGVVFSTRPDLACAFGILEPDEYQAGHDESTDCHLETSARTNTQLIQAATAMDAGLNPAGKAALRLLLLRLMKLGNSSNDFSLALLPASDPLLKTDPAREVLQKLEIADIIKAEGNTKDPAHFLVYDSLLTTWPRLKQLCDERKSFREMASGWDKGGRQKASLLNRGSQLTQAFDYLDLNPTEQEFLAQSRRQSEQHWKIIAAILFIIIAMTIVAYSKVVHANNELKNLNETLGLAIKAKDEANEKLKRVNTQMEIERDNASKKAEDLKIANAKVDAANRKLNMMNTNLGVAIKAKDEANGQLQIERDQAAARVKDLEIAIQQLRVLLKTGDELLAVQTMTNVVTSPHEKIKREETIKNAEESFENVKRNLNSQFKRKF